jgi:Predicted flavoprotein
MCAIKQIFAIIGSASSGSSNEILVNHLARLANDKLSFTIFNQLKSLPHFDPGLSINNPPAEIIAFRQQVEQADGILICTPEYVFSIPSGLKNAIEWCISTTVFSGKPCGLITASANGQKGHEELQLIMKTAMAVFNADTTLLIGGIKGKVNEEGKVADKPTLDALTRFSNAFIALVCQEA